MYADLNMAIAREHVLDLQTAAHAHSTLTALRPRRAASAKARTAASPEPAGKAQDVTRTVAIRTSKASDAPALARLARLDGDGFVAERFASRAATGDVLLAEVDGAVVAAVILGEARILADPFLPSAGAAELLRLRAAQLGSLPHEPRRPVVGALRPRLH